MYAHIPVYWIRQYQVWLSASDYAACKTLLSASQYLEPTWRVLSNKRLQWLPMYQEDTTQKNDGRPEGVWKLVKLNWECINQT